MSAIWPILIKEFKHIYRDRRSLGAALLLPLLMLVLFGYAISLDVRNVDIAVIDHDQSDISKRLLADLCADGTIRVKARPSSEDELELLIDRNIVRMGVVIPPGFGSDLTAAKNAPLQVLVDGTEASFAGLALAQVAGSLQMNTVNRLQDTLRMMGRREPLPTLRGQPRIFYNENLNSQWFIIPGLIGVIIMQMAALLTSLCVAREYERNTIEQILVSPVSGPAFMLGKLIPYVAVGIAQVTLVTLVSRFLFHVPIRGSLLLLSISTLLYLFGSMGLGLLLSAALKSQQVAMQVALLATMLPSFLLSGFIFPISNMPGWLQVLSHIVPARYYLRITRGLFLKGLGLEALWPDVLAMLIFAVLLLTLSVSRFRRSLS